MTGRVAGGFFLWVDDGRQRRRRSLLGQEIVNTVVRSNLVLCHAGPLAAITWFADSWCELASLGDVGHAVALEEIQVGTGINGAQAGSGPHVCCLICANVLSDGHVVRLVAGAAAGLLGGAAGFSELTIAGCDMLAKFQVLYPGATHEKEVLSGPVRDSAGRWSCGQGWIGCSGQTKGQDGSGRPGWAAIRNGSR